MNPSLQALLAADLEDFHIANPVDVCAEPAWLTQANIEADRQVREHWAGCVWGRNTSLQAIADYGWGGLCFEQTLHICIANGYAMCVAEPYIKARWAYWDADFDAFCNSAPVSVPDESTCLDTFA